MFKKLTMVIFVILLTLTPANTITLKELEDNTTKRCDALYEGSNAYYCVLSQFYALSRIFSLHTKERESIINGLMTEYFYESYQTTDFVMVLRDLEEYIEETKGLNLEPGQREK